MKSKPIIVVQGAQWGSEAKGAVSAFLSHKRKVSHAVRTGAVNAGHTVMWEGYPQKMQQIPTAWTNPLTKLVLGAGTFVHPSILASEISLINSLTGTDVRERLYIDLRASLHLEEHTLQAKLENRHHAIGATGKGCSVAITDKIRYRGKGYRLFLDWWQDRRKGDTDEVTRELLSKIVFTDTVDMLHSAYDNGEQLLLEGTQGSLLDLHLGPYPYTTHKQTQAAQWVVEAGLSPSMEYEIVMVARTYPIRVAGNSGPMANETTWPNLARTINRLLMTRGRLPQRVKSHAIEEFDLALHDTAQEQKDLLPKHNDGSPNFDMHLWTAEQRVKHAVMLSELHKIALQRCSATTLEELSHLFEMTTVTKKLRRISKWNAADVRWSCRVNRGSYLILTFFNYIFPELWDRTEITWTPDMTKYIDSVSMDSGLPVRYVTVGADVSHILPVPATASVASTGR